MMIICLGDRVVCFMCREFTFCHPVERIFAGGVTVAGETTEERLKRAKGYPYRRPSSSFLFVNGKSYTFKNSTWRGVENIRDLEISDEMNDQHSSTSAGALVESLGLNGCAPKIPEDWSAVLAIGSNAAPEQLARKFPLDLFPEGIVVPAVQGVLHDFDVVYAPLVSSYGSCTATLEYSPGCACEVFVTYLTNTLMDRMNATEGAYFLCDLTNIVLHMGTNLEAWSEMGKGVEKLDRVLQYNHQHGTLHMPFENGTESPVALKEIRAHDRVFPERSQTEMLSFLKQNFLREENGVVSQDFTSSPSTGDALDSWILTYLDNPDKRLKIVEKLKDAARPFKYPDSRVLAQLGDLYSENVK